MKYAFVIFSAMALSLAVSCTKMDDRLPSDDSHGSGNIMADPSSYKENMLRIKVSAPYADRLASLEGSDGVVTSVKSSAVFGDPNILYMKRTFNKGGKYEQRRRSHGLHLWYDVYLDNASALTKSQSLFSETEGVEIIELVPVGKLDGQARPAGRDAMKQHAESSELPFDDPLLADQWHYRNDGSVPGSAAGCDINIVPLWNEGVKGADVIVAVIDGAVDAEHEDLAANMWVNEEELNGLPGVDDDNNGYVDDIHGYNFYADNAILAYHDHGTHVAGIVAAVNNNGIGVSGVAGGDAKEGIKGARIMSCALFGSNNEFGNFADAMAYAADNGAVIAQNSWSYGYRETQIRPSDKAAIDYFIETAGKDDPDSGMHGGIVIFAAGNYDQSIGYPAAYDKVFAVASLAADYEKASTSNYGDWADISAPGGDTPKNHTVLSTITTAAGKYGEMTGTSQACPQVSGIAALIIANNEEPGFTPDKLRDKLLNSSRNVDMYNRGEVYEGLIGRGLVNAYNAVLRTGSEEAPYPVGDLSLETQSNKIYAEWTPSADPDEGMAYGFALCYSESPIDVSAGAENLPAGVAIARFESENYAEGEKAEGHAVAGFDTDYYVTMYAYDLSGNCSSLSPVQEIRTGGNNAPVIEPSSVDVSIAKNEKKDIALSISDPDGHSFSWDAVRASEALVVEQTSDDEITLHFDGSKAAIRTHKGSLTVTDEYGASSSVDIIYTITGIYPPELIKEFNDVRMTSNMKQVGFDLSEYFKDADNEILSYSATASVEGIVEFEIDSDNLIIRKLEEGITDVTVRASDSKGDYAEDTFTVNTGIDPGSGSVSVSPNPAVDYVEVRVSVPSDDADIKLVNPLGHVVYAAEGVEISMSSPCRIGLEGLAAGTYSVSVTSSGRTETARFVKL